MKKIKSCLLKLCFVFALFLTLTVSVNAETVYYTNSKGVEMTQEQYEYLSSKYSKIKIDNFSQDQFDIRMYADSRTSSDIYIIEEEHRDIFGKIIYTNVKELSENEYSEYKKNKDNIQTRASVGANVTTSEVRMHLEVNTFTAKQSVSVDISTQWLSGKIPSVKSFDVNAFRFTTTGSLQLARFDAAGYQDSDAGSVTYSNEGGNSKWDPYAYGISMNIIDGTKKSLTLETGAEYYYFGSGTMNVTGTYQHATRDVTLEQSKSYNFSANGCGGVVDFYNNVGNYYNSNPGVSLSHNL